MDTKETLMKRAAATTTCSKKKMAEWLVLAFLLIPTIAMGQESRLRLAPYTTSGQFLNQQIAADTLANGKLSNRVYILQRGGLYLANTLFDNSGNWTLRIRANDSTSATKAVIMLYPTQTGATPWNPPSALFRLEGNLEMKGLLITGYYELADTNLRNLQGALITVPATASVGNITIDSCILSNSNGNHIRTDGPASVIRITNSIFANMGYLGRSTLGAGKAVDLRDTNIDTLIMVNNSFVNWQDRIVRHLPSGSNTFTGQLKYFKFDHNTLVNGTSYHGMLVLGTLGPQAIITNNLFIDPFALGNDSDTTRQVEFAQNGEFDAYGRPRMTWVLSFPDGGTSWSISNNYYSISDSGQAFYNQFNSQGVTGEGKPLTWHINNLIADSTNAFKKIALTLTRAPKLMTNFMRWYRAPNGGNKTKNTPGAWVYGSTESSPYSDPNDYDRKGFLYFRDSLDCSYSTISEAYAAGTGGFPVGDLNWFPAQKAAWLSVNGPQTDAVTFRVNMKVKMKEDAFRPDMGDVVTVRGSFNGWSNQDTLKDLDADSIYIKEIIVPAETVQYKFYKSLRKGLDWENGNNRMYSVSGSAVLPVTYFDNDSVVNPPASVTFQVNMKLKMYEGSFRPDLGDIVTVAGDFNNWSTSTDTLKDINVDSVFTKTLTLSQGSTIHYKFFKTLRSGLDWEQAFPTVSTNREFTITSPSDTIPLSTFNGLSSPALSSPANGAVNVQVSVSLQWNGVAGASYYRVQVSTSVDFSSLYSDISHISATTINSNLAPGTTYYWRVLALDSSETTTSSWSSTRSLTTVSSVPLPTTWHWQFDLNFFTLPTRGLGIHGMAVDRNGRVWIGPYNLTDSVWTGSAFRQCGLIYVYNPNGTSAPFSPIKFLVGAGVNDTIFFNLRGMSADPNGNILVSIRDVLYRLDYLTGAVMNKTIPMADQTLTAAATDSSGNIVVGHVLPGFPIHTYSQNFSPIGSIDNSPGFSRSLAVSPGGNEVYWPDFATNKLYTYTSGNGILGPYTRTDSLVGLSVESMAWQPKTGLLWISSGSTINIPTPPYSIQTWYGYDVARKMIVDTIAWNQFPGTQDARPRAIAFSKNGDTAYVGMFNIDTGTVQRFVARHAIAPTNVTIPLLQQVPVDSLLKLDAVQAAVSSSGLDDSPNWHGADPNADTVRVTGVVLVKPRVLTYTLARYNIFIQDTTTGQLWGGLNILTNDTSSQAQSTMITAVDTGQVVTMVGRVTEFGAQNNSLTEIFAYKVGFFESPQIIQIGTTLPRRPDPKEVTCDSFALGATPIPSKGEKYEGMYVVIRNVTVNSVDTSGRFTFIDDHGNQMRMYDGSGWYTLRGHRFGNSLYSPPTVGTRLSYIRGVVLPQTLPGTCGDYAIMPMYPGPDQLTGSSYPGDIGIQQVSRNITFQASVGGLIALGFNRSTDSLVVVGSFNGWNAVQRMVPSGDTSVFQYSTIISGTPGTVLQYKYRAFPAAKFGNNGYELDQPTPSHNREFTYQGRDSLLPPVLPSIFSSYSRSAAFDGVTARIRVADNSPVHLQANPAAYKITGNTITVEAWVFPFDLPAHNYGRVIVMRPANGGIGVNPVQTYSLTINNYSAFDAPRFAFEISDGSTPIGQGKNIFVSDTALPAAGKWTHLAGTYDGTTARLYVNDKLVRQINGSINIGVGSAGFYVGGVSYDYFKGLIDEVRIWNICRSQNAIVTAMYSGLAGNESGLAGYWPLDSTYVSNSLTITPDKTSNHNDLVLQNSLLVLAPFGSNVQLPANRVALNPVYVATDAPVTMHASANGWPAPSISFSGMAPGMTVAGSDLNWTPGPGQWGPFSVHVTALNSSAGVDSVVALYSEGMRTVQNLITLDVTNRGKLGAFGQFARGLSYKGKQGLFAADFSVVARGANKYAGGLYSAANSFKPVEGFTNVPSKYPGFSSFRTSFTDEWELSRIGLKILQTTYSKPTEPDHKYVILEYKIVNISGGPLNDLFAQLSADFDVGNFASDLGAYDSVTQTVYTYEAAGATNPYYYGFQLLNRPPSGVGISIPGQDVQWFRTNTNLTTFSPASSVPSDIRNQISTGPFALAVGETATVAFTVMAGDTPDDLKISATQAKKAIASALTYSHRIVLPQGWNMISSYILPADSTLDTVFARTRSRMLLMKNGVGQVYWPSLGVNQIGTWNFRQGYQAYMSSADTLILNGYAADPSLTSLGLGQGWNMVSYLRPTPMSSDTALATLAGKLVIAKNGLGQVFWPALGINTIGALKAGQGYQIYLANPGSLSYPANPAPPPPSLLTKRAGEIIAPNGDAPKHYPVLHTQTSSNATFLLQLSDVGNGDEVAIRNGKGVVVGSAVVQSGRALISVWGDDPQTQDVVEGAVPGEVLSIAVWLRQREHTFELTSLQDGLTGQNTPQPLKYSENAVWIGLAKERKEIPTEFSLMQNYPNPFNPSTTIKYGLPKDSRVLLEIYNVLGQRVSVLADEVQTAGFHEVQFQSGQLPSGIYFSRLTADTFVSTKKMELLK